MSVKSLNTEEMSAARESFGYCMHETIAQLTEGELAKVRLWLSTKIQPMIPCFALRVDSVHELNDAIFGDVEIRDFCLNLTFRFFALNGSDACFAHRLAMNLKEGLAIDGPFTELSVIPAALKPSMAQSVFQDVRRQPVWGWLPFTRQRIGIEGFLVSNKHLITVLMLYLTAPAGLPTP